MNTILSYIWMKSSYCKTVFVIDKGGKNSGNSGNSGKSGSSGHSSSGSGSD